MVWSFGIRARNSYVERRCVIWKFRLRGFPHLFKASLNNCGSKATVQHRTFPKWEETKDAFKCTTKKETSGQLNRFTYLTANKGSPKIIRSNTRMLPCYLACRDTRCKIRKETSYRDIITNNFIINTKQTIERICVSRNEKSTCICNVKRGFHRQANNHHF